jgi:L-lactate dehydrogenase complex protein LldG
MSSENSPAREEIFASIRKNLAASAPFDAVRKEHHHDLITQSASVSVESSQTATERFRENLEAVGGKCTIVNNKDEAVAAIQTIIESANPTRIAVSDSPIVRAIRDSIHNDTEMLDNVSAQELFNCELGITSAQYAIAETGTLVLESEKEFSRLTSLVPPVHVCVLEAGNIRATMAEILQTVKNELSPTVTFITGPSRTSDIELTLAIGVHGPRELYVIVVDSL